MSKPLTMTEQRKADIEHAIDHPSQADHDGEMHTFACNLWDEAEALRAALAAAEAELAQTGGELGIMKNQNTMLKVALADEKWHADAGYRALDELATFTLEDFPNLDARHPKACVTPAYRNANIAAVDHLKAHAARRAAEVANG